MSIKISKVPAKNTRRGLSLFDILVPRDDRSEIVRNPGVTYQLRDDARPDSDLFAVSDVNAMQAAARKHDMRIQSRAVEGSRGKRHVWVSFEPGYLPEPRNRKKAN